MDSSIEQGSSIARIRERFAARDDLIAAFLRRLAAHGAETQGWDSAKRSMLAVGPAGAGKSYFFNTACRCSQVAKHCITVDATALFGLLRRGGIISPGSVLDCLCQSSGVPVMEWAVAGQRPDEQPAVIVLDNLDELIQNLKGLQDPLLGTALQRALASALTRTEWRFGLFLNQLGFPDADRQRYPDSVYTWPLFVVGVGRFDGLLSGTSLPAGGTAGLRCSDLVCFGMDRELAACFDTLLYFPPHTADEMVQALEQETNSLLRHTVARFAGRGRELTFPRETLDYLIGCGTVAGTPTFQAVEACFRQLALYLENTVETGSPTPASLVVTPKHAQDAGVLSNRGSGPESPLAPLLRTAAEHEKVKPAAPSLPGGQAIEACLTALDALAGEPEPPLSIHLCAQTGEYLQLKERLSSVPTSELWTTPNSHNGKAWVVRVFQNPFSLAQQATEWIQSRVELSGRLPDQFARCRGGLVIDDDRLVLELEWSERGILDNWQGVLKLADVIEIGGQVCRAIREGQAAGVPPFDVSLANILLREVNPVRVVVGDYQPPADPSPSDGNVMDRPHQGGVVAWPGVATVACTLLTLIDRVIAGAGATEVEFHDIRGLMHRARDRHLDSQELTLDAFETELAILVRPTPT